MTTIITGKKNLTRKTANKLDRAMRELGATLVENGAATGNRWWVNAPAYTTQEGRAAIRKAAVECGVAIA
jgi:hypothetical protein